MILRIGKRSVVWGRCSRRFVCLTSLTALMSLILVETQTSVAGATPAQPPVDYSFYVDSSSVSTINTKGCNQGNFDVANHSNSFVYLDFGGQENSNAATLTINNITLPYSSVEQLSEQFALGYYDCTGSDTSAHLTLVVGTNNSYYANDFGGGQGWGDVVDAVGSNVASFDAFAQISIWGGSDIEAWGTPGSGSTGTLAWVQGVNNTAPSYAMLDYGSADGCPPFGSCNGGWSQYDYWYVGWGFATDWTAPQIYNSGQAEEWAAISAYGQNYQGRPINFAAVQDESDNGKNGDNTPQQAWSDFWYWLSYYGQANYTTNAYAIEIWYE